jgi:hypothetical protein
VNPLSKYKDYMPPDNDWFGQKKITIQVGDETIIRPMWFFYLAPAKRYTRQGGKLERAWFHYFKDGGAVPALAFRNFEYNELLDAVAQYEWHLTNGEKYSVGPQAYYSEAMKPVFGVDATGKYFYEEEQYPEDERETVHHLAKFCRHEYWHCLLHGEVRKVGGLGHPDSDGDRLSDKREAELGSDPNKRDTFGLVNFDPENYSSYKNYADHELFARWKQDESPKGDVSKDWSEGGAQYPKPGM